MKIFPAGSLTLAATLLLQLGSFANAMPTFTDTSYLGDLEACKDFRITYPSTTGYSFEDSSRHAVVWEVPEGATQVNLTLIENSTRDIRYVGIYREFEFIKRPKNLCNLCSPKVTNTLKKYSCFPEILGPDSLFAWIRRRRLSFPRRKLWRHQMYGRFSRL
ncbi:hypothetical protein CLU79DRAFT_587 [Phycomyces nitens]|nr:hypothetical protein CLU79DRAFT_587 [Phycomyces nitens]